MSEHNFDFDAWAKLAQEDPNAFEAKRQAMIDELIETAPEELQQRLRSFQWRIDMVRQRSDNPLQACIRISNMMWDLIYADRGFMWSLQVMAEPRSMLALEPASPKRADVLTLRPK